ncbi:hypothetical protein P5673_012291 [Acropora cervicornis]|uniref:Secreted protein n=1 Tax=Acropora cervicornis TaxID=6130 RepID=A0AAD9QN79_ACRCE|nr:hypothetical protein P5673_012291 [Acropora cervicornis]
MPMTKVEYHLVVLIFLKYLTAPLVHAAADRGIKIIQEVKKLFCQGRNGTLSYRFTGKETRIMCQNFMKLVKAVSSEQDTPIQSLQINTFAFVGLQLRVATSRFSRANIDQKVLQELKDSCKMYFNACSLLLGSVSTTVWTIGHAVPFHTA